MTPRRITVVASEILGRAGTGGAGTADSLLAVALGRNGHDVELLVASGREIGELDETWRGRYADAGVRVRVLEQRPGVRPPYLAPPLEVYHALREREPEVVVVNDWRGLGFAALRARQTGVALLDTAFVVHCHGPGRVLTEFAQKVPDTLERFGESVAERTAVGLADAVVSPSQWLLDWMRDHHWPVPRDANVIQYLRESVVFGDHRESASASARIRRIAFFGQLREGKGIRVFTAALGAVEPRLLDGVELIFLGSARGRWTEDSIAAAVPAEVRARAAAIRFETHLARDDALDELGRPGTLAVMPSLLDNSPNTVAECIEHGIPFVAAHTGGIPELIAAEDHDRVLFRPVPAELAAALAQALRDNGFAAARPARDPHESLASWLQLVDNVRPPRRRSGPRATHVAIVATDDAALQHARRLASATHDADVAVVAAGSRREGLLNTAAEWVLFLDADDDPDDELVDALVRAQATSGADVVTVAARPPHGGEDIHLFLGDPGALGLVENQYGVVALIRASLLAGEEAPATIEADWPLLAQLALAGASVVSIPHPLVRGGRPIGNVTDVPGDGVRVLELFERADAEARDLPQLAATLAAAHMRSQQAAAAQTSRRSVRARLRATLDRR